MTKAEDGQVTIMAVARKARVSAATVSRVINGTAFVAPATEKRVRAAIATLNFYPDINARALGSGRSGLYGLIISDITNPYFPELVKAFEDIAVAHGQEVLIANTNYDPARMETCVTRMLQRKVDGVAIMTSEMDDRLVRTLSHRKIPIVFMDTNSDGGTSSVLRVNYEAGVRAAIDHLCGLGHRRIAFLSGPPSLASARRRADAFQAALQAHGLQGESRWVEQGDHRVEGGREAMLRILRSKGVQPTAVLASNDLTAIGALGAIREMGLQAPKDMSVVGFDGIDLSAYTEPALTTLVVPRSELSTLAFRSLFQQQRRAGESAADQVPKLSVLEPVLVVRGSTAAIR